MCCVLSINAQPVLRNYTIENGLPSNMVYTLSIDTMGYLWGSHELGMWRYNGEIFDNNNTPNKETIFCQTDICGRVWLIDITYQLHYIEASNKMNLFSDKIDRFFITDSLLAVVRDRIDGSEVKLYDIITLKYIGSYHIKNEIVKAVTEFKKQLWIFTKDNVYKYCENGVDSIHYGNKVEHIKTYSIKNTFFYSREEKLYATKGDNAPFEPILKDSIHINSFIVTTNDEIIYCTNKGLYYVKPYSNTSPISLIENVFATSIIQDSEGYYWVSTLNNGVFSFSLEIKNIPNDITGVTIIKQDYKGDVIVGTTDGKLLNYTQKKYLPYKHAKYIAYEKQVRDFLILRDKALIAYNDRLSYYFQGKLQKTDYIAKSCMSTNPIVKSIAPYNEDSIFLAVHNALLFLDLKKGRSERIANYRCTKVFVDNKKILWIGTPNGLYTFNFGDVTPKQIKNNKLSYAHITTITEDIEGRILVGTQDQGFFWKDTSGWHSLMGKQLLSSNTIRSVFVDGKNRLWIGTNKGLYRLRFIHKKEAYELTQINEADAFLKTDIKDILVKGDTIYSISNHQLNTIVDGRNSINIQNPRIVVDGIWINNYSIDLPIKKIVQPYPLNNFGISFHTIQLHHTESIRCQYRMLGLNPKWQISSDKIEFGNLSPGRYVFEVKIFLSDNPRNENISQLVEIEVLSPFWQKKWFTGMIFIACCLFLFLIFLLYKKYLTRKLQKTNAINIQIASLQEKALRAQLNPHFIFNSLNAIKEFILKNEPEQSEKYLNTFAKLMRQIMDNSRNSSITIKDEIAFIDLYLKIEKLRFNSRFDYEITTNNIDINQKIPAMLLQPFIENSIRHGKIGNQSYLGKLNIEFYTTNTAFFCTIKDNGIGLLPKIMAENNIGRSHSLEILRERIKAYNMKIPDSVNFDIESNTDYKGVTVIIRILNNWI